MKVQRYIFLILFLSIQHYLFATPSTAITDPSNLAEGTEYYIGATTGEADYYLKLSSLQKGQVGGQVTQVASEATIFKLEKNGGNWRIVLSNGYYLSINGETNTSLSVSSSVANWTLTSVDGLIRAKHSGNRCLQKYSNGSRFGSYTGLQQNLWFVPVANQTDCNVYWKVNGVSVGSGQTSVTVGDSVTQLPPAPTSAQFDGVRKFMGWTDTEVVDGQKPSLLFTTADGAKPVSHDVTYHAVFAKENEASTVWVRQTTMPLEKGKYVFVSNDKNHYTMTSNANSDGTRLVKGHSLSIDDVLLSSEPDDNEIWDISPSSSNYLIMSSNKYLSYDKVSVNKPNNITLLKSSTNAKWSLALTDGLLVAKNPDKSALNTLRLYGTNWGLYNASTGSAPMLFKEETASTYDRYSTVASVSVQTNGLGWATFAPSYNVELPAKQNGVKLYYIASTVSQDGHSVAVLSDLYSAVSSEQVLEAGTGILIKTDNHNVSVTFPVNHQAQQIVGKTSLGNLLTGVLADEPFEDDSKKNAYIFTKIDDLIGFFPWGDGTLKAGKCYLQLPESLANAPLVIELSESTDGIEKSLSGSADAGEVRYFDLSGRPVTNVKRGIVLKTDSGKAHKLLRMN